MIRARLAQQMLRRLPAKRSVACMADAQGRDYSAAISALNSVQSNHAIVEAIRGSRKALNELSLPEMREWCRAIGLDATDLERLHVIHIAGTKGKGSTAAFVSSILKQYSEEPGPVQMHNVGLYTSPHLRFVRERIRLNDEILSESEFAAAFFHVWDRLETRESKDTDASPSRPNYFRFLTLMAFRYFLSKQVDATVLECGIGGAYDATNVIDHPVVTGISSLGIDHTAILGSSIEEIAWHKAGIMKRGAPAFTVPQLPAAMAVLEAEAASRAVELTVVPIHPEIKRNEAPLGLAGEVQKANASLAVALVAGFLEQRFGRPVLTNPLPPAFRRGLAQVQLSGRCETRLVKSVAWYVDGAHTVESIAVATQWYAGVAATAVATASNSRQSTTRPLRILVFNQQTRTESRLLEELHAIAKSRLGSDEEEPFDHAIFCSNITYVQGGYKPDLVSLNVNDAAVRSMDVQRSLAETWRQLTRGRGQTQVLATIEEAVQTCLRLAAKNVPTPASAGRETSQSPTPQVFATGSMHLVGGLLDVLDQVEQDTLQSRAAAK